MDKNSISSVVGSPASHCSPIRFDDGWLHRASDIREGFYNLRQTVRSIESDDVGKGRRRFHDVCLSNIMPNRQDLASTLFVESDESAEFTLSPVLPKECGAQHDDSELRCGKAAC